MKRTDLMKRLSAIAKAQEQELVLSEGAEHTKVKIGDRQNVVPRHKEINEITAKKIIEHFETKKED
ncbi:hypothetical protein N864_11780 [Intrasporangium chromatireducens Q5-1]|uniref:Toxin HicA n=1 Tax=Intrasporangium chromatireducens Q5-1 TaxID=584657 RepID=W9GP08_9MICO|nr:hypothetical protein [Intrasporangium chromatireducens]EWT07986.1 hypothetical protein N864_11780 [Intrasporangium chromatireducens Q5-1]